MNLQPILKTASVFLIALFISLNVNAQVWNTVGNGIPVLPAPPQNTAVSATSDSNYVYVARYYHQNFMRYCYIDIWNGIAWFSTPPVPGTDFGCWDIEVINREIYIVGASYQGNPALYKFDGISWIPVSPSPWYGEVSSLYKDGDTLIMCGSFTGVYDYIMKYHGNTFYSYPTAPANHAPKHVAKLNGKLYFTSVSSVGSNFNSFQRLNDSATAWILAAHYTLGPISNPTIRGLIEYNGSLITLGASSFPTQTALFKYDESDTLKYIGGLDFSVRDMVVHNNELYFAGDVSFNGTNIRMAKYDGTNIIPLYNSPLNIRAIASFKNELYVFSDEDIIFDSITYNNAFRSKINSSIITGKSFMDINSDCIKQPTEPIITNVCMKLAGTYMTNTRNTGEFTIGLAPGTYSVDTVFHANAAAKNLIQNCSFPSNLTVSANQITTQDIPFSNSVPVDLKTLISTSTNHRARHGFTQDYYIQVINTGNTSYQNASCSVEIPATFNMLQTSLPPVSTQGNNYQFNLGNIPVLGTFTITIRVEIDTALNIVGNDVFWVSTLNNISNDADLTDNSDTLRQTIVSAYDPNDKTASDEFISPSTKRIDYHIRFQNTGTDTAYKVVVVDSLNTSLALTNVVINSASHPYNFSVQNNVLVWEFDNIMLPDSGADYLGSQGYVNFSTGINPALGLGDSVTNDANIYFDFQWPITTNTAKTTIVNNISVLEQGLAERVLEVYPNPARDIIRIKNTSATDLKVQITNTSGQVISSFTLKPREELNYQCSNLPVGMYILSTQFEGYKILITN